MEFFERNIMERAFFKIALNGMLPWFGIAHAKVLLAMHKRKLGADAIARETGFKRETVYEALDELLSNKIIPYCNERQFTADALESANLLIDLCEDCNSKKAGKAVQKELAMAYA